MTKDELIKELEESGFTLKTLFESGKHEYIEASFKGTTASVYAKFYIDDRERSYASSNSPRLLNLVRNWKDGCSNMTNTYEESLSEIKRLLILKQDKPNEIHIQLTKEQYDRLVKDGEWTMKQLKEELND